MLKALKKSLLIFLKASLILMLLFSCAVGALFYWVSTKPLVLDSYKPYIRERLSSMMGGADVDFDHAVFRWKQIHKPFYVSVQNLKVIGVVPEALSVTVPKAHIKLDPFKMLWGKLIPSKLVIFDPTIAVRLEETLEKSSAEKETEGMHHPEMMVAPLLDFLNNPKPLATIKNIEVINAKTTVGGLPATLAFLQESVTNFTIVRDAVGHLLSLEVKAGPVVLDVDAIYKTDDKAWKIVIDHQNVPLNYALEMPSAGIEESKVGRVLFRSSGSMMLNYISGEGLTSGTIKLHGVDGTVENRAHFLKPLKIDDISCTAHYENKTITLEALALKIGATTLQVAGEGALTDSGNALHIAMQAEVRNVLLKDLPHLWPIPLAPVPRTWVTENIKVGRIPLADLKMRVKLYDFIEAPRLEVDELSGKIDIHQVSVDYLKGMPEATSVSGVARYDPKTFHIDVTEGACHGQAISKGSVIITKMDEKDQDIAIDLTLKGPLKSALSLIDYEPLKYASSMDLKPDTASGETSTHLKLAFPLERTVTLDQVKVEILSTLHHTGFDAPLDILPLRVTRGDFTLKVNDVRLMFEGDALINQSKSHIQWQRNFKTSEPLKNKLVVNGDMDAKMWAHCGLEKVGTLEGVAPLHLVYEDRAPAATLLFSLPLRDVALSIFGAKKEKGIEGHVDARATFKQGRLQSVNRFEFKAGETIAIVANADFNGSSALPTKITFETLTLGKTSIKPTFKLKKNKTYHLTIAGGTLDLDALLDQMAGDERAQNLKEPLDASIMLDQLYWMGDQPLRKVTADASVSDGLLRFLNLRGFFSASQNDRTLFVMVHSPTARQRILEVSTSHFGELMQSLGVSDRLLDGRLAITATHDNKEESPWVGRFKVYNFRLKDPPVLGQLLSLAFPTGLVDLLSDKGMPFSSFSTRFKYTPYLIQLSEGRAKGSSLGLTVSGSIVPKSKDLKLQGTVLPAYFLNTLIAKIPLLGEIITGGKNEGLFGMTYTITGRFEKPKIVVNPLSALTPGLIRKIFSSEEEEFEAETNPPAEDESE